MGTLIVIEGTDCSGKETQTNLLYERLIEEGHEVERFSFPMYETATGKIVGGPYLGKSYICEGWFSEGASNVDPYVASLYYAADRKYNIEPITKALEQGKIVLLDRYVTSNMGHQCGKIKDDQKRKDLYKFIENLEYDMLGLPRPDLVVFLHLPSEYSLELKQSRSKSESLDQHESDLEHLKLAERSYLELVDTYDWQVVECVKASNVKSREDIHEEVYKLIKKL